MNFPRNSSYTAQQRFFATFGRFFLNILNLGSFYGTTKATLASGKPQIEKQWQQAAKEGFTDPAFSAAFDKNPLFQKADFPNRLSAVMAKRSARLAEQAIDSAALVFAHTILDELLSDCCRISFVAEPNDWLQFIDSRKLQIGDLRKENLTDLLKQKSWEFVSELERQSMLERFDYLHKVCAPRLKGEKLPTAWVQLEALKAFDEMRHRVVHGPPFSPQKTSIESQMYFAKTAGLSMLLLVSQAFDLTSLKDTEVHEWRLLRLLVVLRRELPEFFELMEDITKRE